MPDRGDIIYRYDGTFEGLMCCVFESYYRKEVPVNIEPFDTVQETLFSAREIQTDEEKAKRVKDSIPERISPQAYELVKNYLLTCAKDKEIKLLQFLRLGFKVRKKIDGMIASPIVNNLTNPVKNLMGEVHLLLGFLRFEERDDYLIAQIEPKNNVLPLLAPHFCSRLPSENFVIYDCTNKLIFLHTSEGEIRFMEADSFKMPEPDENEKKFRQLWKLFVNTIAIEGRENYKNQRSHMPKRFWRMMVENEKSPPEKDEDKSGNINQLPAETL